MTLGIIVTQIMCTCMSRSQQPFGNCCHGLGLQLHQVGWQPDGIHACVSPRGKYIAWGLSFYLHTPCNTQNYLEKALESQVGRHDLNASPHLTNTRINKSQLCFSMVPSNTHLPEKKWRFCKQLCFCVLLFLSASAIGA